MQQYTATHPGPLTQHEQQQKTRQNVLRSAVSEHLKQYHADYRCLHCQHQHVAAPAAPWLVHPLM